jgi:hypothetical protein
MRSDDVRKMVDNNDYVKGDERYSDNNIMKIMMIIIVITMLLLPMMMMMMMMIIIIVFRIIVIKNDIYHVNNEMADSESS